MNDARLRAVGIVLLIAMGSVACGFLGLWQLHRHQERVAQVDVIESNFDAAPVPLAEVMPGDALDPARVWQPVEITGTWIESSGVQLRNRPVQDANASHALALFLTDEAPARALVVDRGWWRQTSVVPDGALDVPTDGSTTITVRLRAEEPLDERSNPVGEVFRVHPPSVVEQSGLDAADLGGALVTNAYGMIADPRPSGVLGSLPEPDTSLRSHLSYALQWWFFGAALPVAAVVLKRRIDADAAEARAAAEGGGATAVPARRRRATMADEEDAILDAAEAAEAAASSERLQRTGPS
ncbi:SURF1 family protein [Serinibacter arcticus]|uniref:SURF1-like protein n=1 Tax=Serinibacter arcticus TaxID=1655435 RepID=A0A4Z1E179_9MICO|nr:SURF1 family protein [Serinibacter arcticus]TGO04442.1 Cytochrome oxidase biogenesis protein Surf1, facilitates heme A insertion [Serinibacter arcticus]